MHGTRLSGMQALCAYIGRSEPTVLKLIREGGLPAKKIRGEWTSDTEMIDEWRRRKIADAAA
ncbi:MAG: helix-turn-helix domain-containing protein [Solidesulfovibrio sp. DCME]|uniref:helix-turn-helix domain-containing protein n=1 Tax=Solidesulfovibrio sp. DCME TaxID=3447380 RepID=UPI003D0EED64